MKIRSSLKVFNQPTYTLDIFVKSKDEDSETFFRRVDGKVKCFEDLSWGVVVVFMEDYDSYMELPTYEHKYYLHDQTPCTEYADYANHTVEVLHNTEWSKSMTCFGSRRLAIEYHPSCSDRDLLSEYINMKYRCDEDGIAIKFN